MFRDSESDIASRKHPEVVGIPIVQGVICADEGDLMALRPAHSHKSDDPRSVRVDDIKLKLSKCQEHSPEGRVGERIPLCPWSFDSAEPVRIRILLVMPNEVRRKNVDAVSTVSELLD